jgi:hypothetical protein
MTDAYYPIQLTSIEMEADKLVFAQAGLEMLSSRSQILASRVARVTGW